MSNFLKGHKVTELLIASPKGDRFEDVRLQSGLISYYEDVTDSSIHFEIDILDTSGKLAKLPVRSGAVVYLTITHPSGEIRFDQNNPLVISNIKTGTATAKREVYTLILETQGSFSNHTTRLYRKYTGKLDTIIRKILEKDLNIKSTRIRRLEETSNTYSFMGNYKKPLFTCTWLCPKSIPLVNNGKNSGTAGYFFYEALDGYYFRSVDNIFNEAKKNKDRILKYNYHETVDALSPDNNYKLVSPPVWRESHDILEKLRLGMYRSSNWFYNIITRSPDFQDYYFGQSINNQLTLSNEVENIPNKIDTYSSRIILGVIDTGTLSAKGDLTTPQYQPLFQSQGIARYASLFSQTLSITVPMNIRLRVGEVIFCNFSKINKQESDFGSDPSSGYYMIKSLAHKFSSRGDFTGLTLVRDSYAQLT